MQKLSILWGSHLYMEYWKIILIAVFLLILNLVISAAMWFVNRGVIIEYGYYNKKRKALKKRLKSYSVTESILLIRLTAEAPRQGLYLSLVLVCHFLQLTGVLLSLVGFLGTIITHADGWALILLTGAEMFMLLITTAIRFIPDIICLPSERKRYF